MSDYNAIADVGETLIELLRENMSDLIPDGSKIALVSPGEIEDNDNFLLSLFLYQVSENINLRNMEMENMGPSKLKAPPLALDLCYMLTSYPQEIGDSLARAKEEHRNLGRAMQVLHDNTVLAGSVLRGSLSANNTELRVIGTSLSLDDLIKIWSTFGGKSFRPSVCYQVTPVRIESSREKTVSRVTGGHKPPAPEKGEM